MSDKHVGYVGEPRGDLSNNPRCSVCGAVMVAGNPWKCLSCGGTVKGIPDYRDQLKSEHPCLSVDHGFTCKGKNGHEGDHFGSNDSTGHSWPHENPQGISRDEQVKGIPQDLREEYEEMKICALRDSAEHYKDRCLQLIERIAHSEQTLRIMQETQANHDWWVKRAGELEQARSALEAIHRGHVEGTLCEQIEKQLAASQQQVAALEARIVELTKPVTDEEWERYFDTALFGRYAEPCQIDALLAARAALKGAS